MKSLDRGERLVVAAFLSFGLLPLFWNLLSSLPPEQVLFHRAFWSAVGLTILLAVRGRLRSLFAALCTIRSSAAVLVSAALLGVNWLTYLIALKDNHLAEASLGYFICPLLSMALGMLFYGERIGAWQKLAVSIVAVGVLSRVMLHGAVPWFALAIATSFSFYQLVRKRMQLDAEQGLAIECWILALLAFPPALSHCGEIEAVLFAPSVTMNALLVMTGVATALPMVWLITGARTASMQFLGITQYLCPTIGLFLAVAVYGEPFTSSDLVCYGLIWLGILVYFTGGRIFVRRERDHVRRLGSTLA